MLRQPEKVAEGGINEHCDDIECEDRGNGVAHVSLVCSDDRVGRGDGRGSADGGADPDEDVEVRTEVQGAPRPPGDPEGNDQCAH